MEVFEKNPKTYWFSTYYPLTSCKTSTNYHGPAQIMNRYKQHWCCYLTGQAGPHRVKRILSTICQPRSWRVLWRWSRRSSASRFLEMIVCWFSRYWMDGFFLYLVFVSIRPLSQLEVMYIIVAQLEVLIQLLLSETLFDFVGLHRPLATTTRFLISEFNSQLGS